MTLKCSINFSYIESFEHDNSKLLNRSVSTRTHLFALIRRNVLTRFFLPWTYLIQNNWQLSSYIIVSRWYECFTRCCPSCLRITRNLRFFFQNVHNILEVNVNIALKKIPLVYIRPFNTHFFGVGTFNVEKCHWFKNANYLKKKWKFTKLCRY